MTYTSQDYAEMAHKANQSGKILAVIDGALVLQDPPEPTEAEIAAKRVAEIDARLAEIDAASVRPLRAIVAGDETEEDRAKLAALDAEAEALREERKEIG